MRILIGAEKGGCGKSTIATNLVGLMHGLKMNVNFIDTDPQETSLQWVGLRRDKRPLNDHFPAYPLRGGRIGRAIEDLNGKCDHIVIDAGGQDSPELRQSMSVADVMIIPVLASSPDVWSLLTQMQINVEENRKYNPELKVLIVTSRASTHANTNDRSQLEGVLSKHTFFDHLCETVIHERKAYRYALASGSTVTESTGLFRINDEKAGQEITKLLEEIRYVTATNQVNNDRGITEVKRAAQ